MQLVKKFPTFHGTRWFITALTSVRHTSISWASPIQSIYPHPTPCRSILILSTHLRLGLPSGPLPFGFPTKTLHTPSPHTCEHNNNNNNNTNNNNVSRVFVSRCFASCTNSELQRPRVNLRRAVGRPALRLTFQLELPFVQHVFLVRLQLFPLISNSTFCLIPPH